MAQIPTIKELQDAIIQDLETELGIKIPTFGKVFLRALAFAQAGKLKLYWLATGKTQKNIWPDTADPVAIGGTLERFGQVKLSRGPFPATQGLYQVDVTGTVSAVVPAGTIFKSDDVSSSPGKLFILDVEKTLAFTTDTMELRALEAGIDSRLVVTDTLTATSPLLNVDDLVTVTVENTIPLAAETIEDYRNKIVLAFQLEAQGGAATDYRVWAADAQGVRFVFPYATSGECSEVDLYVEANQVDSTDGKGTPTAAILSDVEDVINFDPDETQPPGNRGRRPIQVTVNFLTVTPKDVIVTVVNPVNIDTAKEAAITASLTQLIDDIRPFVEAADIIDNKNDILDINRVISTIQGLLVGNEQFDSVTMTVDAVPVTTSITFLNGDIPFLTSVVF